MADEGGADGTTDRAEEESEAGGERGRASAPETEEWEGPSPAAGGDDDDGGGGGGDDDDDEAKTDIDVLRKVWSNEKAAPEILGFEAHLVERVQEQVLLMEENIAALAAEGAADELMLSLYRMDVNRALFLLRSYLRTRLRKIERHPAHIVDTAAFRARLSESELDYACRYRDALGKHLDRTVLSRLPENYRSLHKQIDQLPEDDMVPSPQLDTFVFCRSTRAMGAFQLDDRGDETVDLMKGDLHILRYRPVRKLLETNRIELI